MLMLTVRALGAMVLMLALTSGMLAQESKTPPAQKEGAAKGQVYDVEAVLDGQPYTGTMTLKIEGTAVTGTMLIEQPFKVTGDVAGTLKGDALQLDYLFSAESETPCRGRVVIAAKMSADGASASGTAETSGCSDAPQRGTFSLKKQAPATKR